MATSWIQEEDTLADMRQRLDRLRGQKARDFKGEFISIPFDIFYSQAIYYLLPQFHIIS